MLASQCHVTQYFKRDCGVAIHQGLLTTNMNEANQKSASHFRAAFYFGIQGYPNAQPFTWTRLMLASERITLLLALA